MGTVCSVDLLQEKMDGTLEEHVPFKPWRLMGFSVWRDCPCVLLDLM